MAQNFTLIKYLYLLCFFISSTHSLPFATNNNLYKSSSLRAQKSGAEAMIRQFNLFPKHSINIVRTGNFSQYPSIVEKRFTFPSFVSSTNGSVIDLGHHAGYFRIPNTVGARMFYFFFVSRRSKADPVVIWLTGGPGCGSELALFYENGPFHIKDDLTLESNDFGWDQVSNIIFVDQPTGTGFSYSSSEDDIRRDEKEISNDLYNFLQEFFKAHPDYVENEFYITGESYAGHYIPALATRIHEGNNNKEGIQINLKGFAIGNGITDPAIQYPAYIDFALSTKLISESDYEKINKSIPNCEEATKLCGTNGVETCLKARAICLNIYADIMNLNPNLNIYDIRKKCGHNESLCYDYSKMETLLNKQSTRDALGVDKIEFVSCSTKVYDALKSDWMRNLETGIPALLEDGINMLIYAGEFDLICNWLGNSRWVNAAKWFGQKEFVAAQNVTFLVDGVVAGTMKSHGPLTFLKVHNAGHLVPMDQPKASMQMLDRWMHGKLAMSN